MLNNDKNIIILLLFLLASACSNKIPPSPNEAINFYYSTPPSYIQDNYRNPYSYRQRNYYDNDRFYSYPRNYNDIEDDFYSPNYQKTDPMSYKY
jgi:hypothetical protein